MVKTTNESRKFSIKLISYFLIFLNMYTQAFANKYEYYRFTTDIYEQKHVLPKLSSGPNLSQDDIKKLEDELLCRKEKELENNCLKKINKNIDELEKQLSSANSGGFKKKLIEDLSLLETAPMVIVGMVTGVLGKFITLGVGIIAGVFAKVGQSFFEKRVNNTRPSQTDPQTIIQEMRTLEKEYKDLKDGLHTEPVCELERRYILQKRHMTNLELQAEIERSLVQSRVADYYFQLNSSAIGYSLALPLSVKPLLDKNNLEKSKEDLIERFEKEKSFAIHKKNVRDSLLNVIMRVAVNSITDESDSPLRVIEHWLGSGSTGKSTAAKAIARFLKLPYFEKRITNPETEIKIESVLGTMRSFQGAPNLGWLAEALLQTIEGNKENYENGFLLLDDFPVNTQNGQNTLLALTDPEKKKIPNQYLQADLNIRRLNIFIITNEDFKSLKSSTEENPIKVINPTFDALKSRLRTTIFPDFNEEQMEKIAKPYLEKTLVSKYMPPVHYKISYMDPAQFKVIYEPHTLEDMGLKKEEYDPILISTGVSEEKRGSITLRELKELLENALNNFLNDTVKERITLFKQGKDLFRKNQNGDFKGALDCFKVAASLGHSEACSILKQIKSEKLTPQILFYEIRVEDGNGDINDVILIRDSYKKKGNTKKFKEWWRKAYQLGNSDHSSLILENLKSLNRKEFTPEDSKLLTLFKKDISLSRQYANIIRDIEEKLKNVPIVPSPPYVDPIGPTPPYVDPNVNPTRATPWNVRSILSNGIFGKEVTQGEFPSFYSTMFPFEMKGKNYILGQSSDRNLAIQEVLEGGKLGDTTFKWQKNNFYPIMFPIKVKEKNYIFGQSLADNNYWFIQEVIEGGILGKKTQDGNKGNFYS